MAKVIIVGEMYDPDLSIWGGPGPVQPPAGGPAPPAGAHPSHPIYITGSPSHPIVIVPPPPDAGEGAPGIPVHLPIYPWTPQHPITLPPDTAPPPSGAHPSHPIAEYPSHPIVLPPTMPDPDNRPVDWKAAWTESTGWIVVGVPSGDHISPSASTTAAGRRAKA